MKRSVVRPIGLLAASILVALVPVLPAQAITYGTPDNGAHAMVGQLFYYNPDKPDPRFTSGGSWQSCSGTLIDDTVVVTAAHCTYPIGEGRADPAVLGNGGTDVWFSAAPTPDLSTLAPSDCFADNLTTYTRDPAKLATCVSFGVTEASGNDARYTQWTDALNATGSGWVHATAYTSQAYDPSTFPLNDLGVLVLDGQTSYSGQYPSLPGQTGLVDELYASDHNATYTVVGYGYRQYGPWGAPMTEAGTRYDGTVKITNLNGVWGLGKGSLIALSTSNGKNKSGGTCYGDSGGPVFSVDPVTGAEVLIAVTSFGPDPYCKAGTGAYRLDNSEALAFIEGFLQPN